MVARSEESRQAILRSTLKLLGVGARGGTTIQKLSIEAIAKHAGVSKSTIYRWWDNKAAVVIDAFVTAYLSHTPVRDDVPFEEALREHVAAVVHQYAGLDGKLVAQLIAEAQYDPATLEEFHNRFWLGRRSAVEALIQRGVEEGVVRSDIDPSMLANLAYSPIYLRLLLQQGPLDDTFAAELVELALHGIGVRAAALQKSAR
ncbi:TetR/AcrR family transcriptional regulator [Georgenia sp. H159]|uniref:TetR/AcrR family transcriptional regulator n=1 Tax=Georgenia sp. H159 TaxID=3076115 RepID=UPI002D77F47B|nr:TetR/AcrR family transcriptional regulator [Georgenia sp. H159]